MKFSVFGASGFIGSTLTARLRDLGHDVQPLVRETDDAFARPLGHVVYAAGITADFRNRPFDTLHANTSLVANILQRGEFDSFLYLSSARIYRHAERAREDARVFLSPEDPEDLYDFTKLTSESLCHATNRNNVRVARMSNVVGTDFRSGNFLYELIRSACDQGEIVLRSALDSAKDYISVNDVVEQIPQICLFGKYSCYNLCSGVNLTHRQVVEQIQAVFGARLSILEDAPRIISETIDISRLRSEFSFQPTAVLPLIFELANEYRKQVHAEN